MDALKLEKLFIGEVSGVDEPANEVPGWLVAKSAAVGPDQDWNVAVAEARIRKATSAEDGPNDEYAACFLWHDPSNAESFAAYKFLACDVVDGVIKVMPRAVSAAAEQLDATDIPAGDKEAIGAALAKLAGKATKPSKPDAPTILEKVRLLLGAKENDVTKEELHAELDTRFAGLSESLVKAVADAAAVAAPAEGDAAAAEAAAAEDAAAVAKQAEAIAAAVEAGVEKALEPYNQILESTLDRLAAAEKALGFAARKSLEGQDGPGSNGEPATPTVADAITKALRNPSSRAQA